MGKPRLPSHLKVVTGTTDKRTANPKEPKPKVAVPPMPEWLPASARAAWEHIAPLLFSMGVLAEPDRMALERLCQAYATIRHCERVLADYGDLTYESMGREGNVMRRQHPEVAILADADRRFHSYLVEFGLTPASRSKVSAILDLSEEDERIARYFAR